MKNEKGEMCFPVIYLLRASFLIASWRSLTSLWAMRRLKPVPGKNWILQKETHISSKGVQILGQGKWASKQGSCLLLLQNPVVGEEKKEWELNGIIDISGVLCKSEKSPPLPKAPVLQIAQNKKYKAFHTTLHHSKGTTKFWNDNCHIHYFTGSLK